MTTYVTCCGDCPHSKDEGLSGDWECTKTRRVLTHKQLHLWEHFPDDCPGEPFNPDGDWERRTFDD